MSSAVPQKVQRAAMQFVAYQRRWLADRSRKKLMVKARRIGGSAVASFSAACKASGYDVCTGEFAPAKGGNVHIISASRQQAREMLKRAIDHIRKMEQLPDDIDQAISLAKKNDLPLTVDVIVSICDELRRVRPNSAHVMVSTRRRAQAMRQDGMIIGDPTVDVVKLANDVEIRAYACNPRTIRGPEGHVIYDEFGVAPHDQKIWEAGAFLARPTLGFPRGFDIEIIGTPEGDDGMFFKLAMTTAGKQFSRHRIDVYQAVRQGFRLDPDWPEDSAQWTDAMIQRAIDDLRDECGLDEIFEQEFCCAFLSASSRYIPVELLSSATYTQEETFKDVLARNEHSATCGLDVAESERSTADPCALVRNYLVGRSDAEYHDKRVFWMDPYILRGRGVSFETQEAWIRAELEGTFDAAGRRERPAPCHRAAVDASGMGIDMAKRLVNRFGDQVIAVLFSPQTKEILATRCKRLFEMKRQRIPDDVDLRRGLLNLHRVISRDSARTLFQMKRDGGRKGGHGDEAWAMMLAQHAAEMLGGAYVPQRGFMTRALGR
jgi:phage FluMu gp28-like protein